ncbi:hypothetical protein EH183_36260 [Streptomyces sp. CB01881]|uniref:hypothetical protein n=1 Tax=Streptomyces sp. CB01881 TaxID=2078691 RepID=UPI000CDC193A|nr:hypothetical protein [Streptomyces sp. CB01881]AUY53432.1 hypothetical protein C2142_36205 [Streptomyces sp. CB01881]TYC69584.1 hypothetical protein EH183_36260 [Streptomyces sp. CB01881]
MSPTALRTNRALRTAALVLVPAGLLLHLWLGTKVPLLAVPIGLACHLAAGIGARRWLRGQRRPTG